MTLEKHPDLSDLSDAERAVAMQRFTRIRPFVRGEVPLRKANLPKNLSLRTAQRWVRLYEEGGLAGLGRKKRADKSSHRISRKLKGAIEGLALKPQKLPVAAVRRQAIHIARRLGEAAPRYMTIHRIISELDPAVRLMAHKGTHAYRDSFDLVYRRKASALYA